MTTLSLDIPELITRLETSIKHTIAARNLREPLLIGIHSGGVWIADKLQQRLQIEPPLGLLDISFYRDDFTQIGVNPKIKPSHLPPNIEGRDIILIDDVFFTGRTIRAALNEIFDYGRPKQVILGVLIERNGRQMPLKPDCIGTKIDLLPNQRIKLTGPEPLGIHIQTVEAAA